MQLYIYEYILSIYGLLISPVKRCIISTDICHF